MYCSRCKTAQPMGKNLLLLSQGFLTNRNHVLLASWNCPTNRKNLLLLNQSFLTNKKSRIAHVIKLSNQLEKTCYFSAKASWPINIEKCLTINKILFIKQTDKLLLLVSCTGYFVLNVQFRYNFALHWLPYAKLMVFTIFSFIKIFIL